MGLQSNLKTVSIVSVACAAHRLALACKDSSNDVRYMATFRDHLQELNLYFRNSANCTATIKAAFTTMGVSDMKVKVVVRGGVRRCPGAKGFYTFCATYRFVAAAWIIPVLPSSGPR